MRSQTGHNDFPKSGPYYRFYAWTMARIASGYEPVTDGHRRALLEPLRGLVVEIGPGTGPNLAFFGPGIRWIGVEPNAHMNPYLENEIRRWDIDGEIRAGTVQALPLETESADHVVGTLLLCSITDQSRALTEVLRVLKPGGRFVFLEHVAAREGSRLRRVQEAITPVWRLIADGCQPNRTTWSAIEQAGFQEVNLEQFQVSSGPFSPHIAGYAVKSSHV